MSKIYHVLDTVVIVGSATLSGAAASILAAVEPTYSEGGASNAELQLFLLPFVGSFIAAGGCIMLNPNPDTRRITIGRAIFALFFGVLIPQIIGLAHPALLELTIKPVMLVLVGGLVASLAYVLSKPFTREMYDRAERVAKREADRLEQKHFPDKDE